MGWKEKDIRGQLLEELKWEEKLWKIKSRVSWLKTPDLNTKFFRISTIVCHRRNYIDALKDPNGIGLQTRDQIGNLFSWHFRTLFTSQRPIFPSGLEGYIPSIISDQDNQSLCVILDADEVWDVVKNLGPTKALGPDGFSPVIFQKFWRIVKDDVIGLVIRFFRSGFILKELNQTNVVLFPKNENPTLVTHYHPISLRNVAYKIIAKLLANRLRKVIHKLVSSSQSAFVPGRRIQDNVILVNEIMHS